MPVKWSDQLVEIGRTEPGERAATSAICSILVKHDGVMDLRDECLKCDVKDTATEECPAIRNKALFKLSILQGYAWIL